MTNDFIMTHLHDERANYIFISEMLGLKKNKFFSNTSAKNAYLTGAERDYLVSKSLMAHVVDRSAIKEAVKKYKTQVLEQTNQKCIELAKTHRTNIESEPIAGSIKGETWNKYLEHVLTNKQNLVFHTIVFPNDQTAATFEMSKAKIISTKQYTLPAGEIPETISFPSSVFEAMIEPTCMTKETGLPSHIIVRDATIAPKCTDEIIKKKFENEKKQMLKINR